MKFSNRFIKASNSVCDFDNHVPAPYFRRVFELDFLPEHAEITICGLGFYELYVNGVELTKGPLAPYISNPDDVRYYDCYDVTSHLKAGKNVIGVLLGNGFRNAFGGFIWDFEKAACRGPEILALALEAKAGEQSLLIEADESFKTHPSPILFNDMRMGYRYDARLEIPNWNRIDLDDSDWTPALPAETPAGMEKICDADPIAVVDTIAPIEIKHYDELPYAYKGYLPDAPPIESTIKKNVYVYDFGVNTAGVTQLRINGKPGQKIVIRHGEYLQEGKFSVNTTIFHSAAVLPRYLEYSQTDVFICKGGEEVFTPKFKYDGFRYAYVEGLLPEQATPEALTYLVMNSQLESRATFSCSNDTMNRLFEMARRSDLANFYYFPTDCPHREKNGWTGDAAMSAEHMLLNLRASKSLREWLTNIRAAQRMDGALPGIVPTGGWGFKWGSGPAWDIVSVYLPYYVYLFDGDVEIIRENAPMILRYLQYTRTKRDADGLVAYGLGDWVDPFERFNKKISSPLRFTDSAVIYDYARKASFLFGVIGMEHEAAYANAIALDMRNAIRRHLIDLNTATVIGNCQTSQALALAFGLFDEGELDAARRKLIEIIHRDGDINACGMLGLRFIFHELSKMGETDLAFKIITSTERSCYGSWIEKGATALLENFPNYEIGKDINSQNHHFLGDFVSWQIRELAGIKINPSVNDHLSFEISPKFAKALTHATATYLSPAREPLTAQWRREGDEIVLDVTVPSDMHGTVSVGDICEAVGAGSHRYVISEK